MVCRLGGTRFRLAEAYHLVHLQCLGHLVGDEQDGDFALEFVDGAGEVFGGGLVEVAHRFVEDQHARALEQGAGDGDALALAAGQSDAILAHRGLVALRQLFDNIVDLGQLAGVDDLFEAGVGVGQLQVFVEGAGEQAVSDYSSTHLIAAPH